MRGMLLVAAALASLASLLPARADITLTVTTDGSPQTTLAAPYLAFNIGEVIADCTGLRWDAEAPHHLFPPASLPSPPIQIRAPSTTA
jgi:hypothetical protein